MPRSDHSVSGRGPHTLAIIKCGGLSGVLVVRFSFLLTGTKTHNTNEALFNQAAEASLAPEPTASRALIDVSTRHAASPPRIPAQASRENQSQLELRKIHGSSGVHCHAPVQLNQTSTTTSTTNNYFGGSENSKGGVVPPAEVKLQSIAGTMLGFLFSLLMLCLVPPSSFTRRFCKGIALAIGGCMLGCWLWGSLVSMFSPPLWYIGSHFAGFGRQSATQTGPGSGSSKAHHIPAVPSNADLIFPFHESVAQLIGDLTHAEMDYQARFGSEGMAVDMADLYQEYVDVTKEMDTEWLDALTGILSQAKSELDDFNLVPVRTASWSRRFPGLFLWRSSPVSLTRRRLARFESTMLSGRRAVNNARDRLTISAPHFSKLDRQKRRQGSGMPVVNTRSDVLERVRQRACEWAASLATRHSMAEGQRGSSRAAGIGGLGMGGGEKVSALESDGNKARAVCDTLVRDRDTRARNRLQALDAARSLLDGFRLRRVALEQNVSMAEGWFWSNMEVLESVEAGLRAMYEEWFVFATKAFFSEQGSR